MRPSQSLDSRLRYLPFQMMDLEWISRLKIEIQKFVEEISFQQTVSMFFQNFIESNSASLTGEKADPIDEAAKDGKGNMDPFDLEHWDTILSKCLDMHPRMLIDVDLDESGISQFTLAIQALDESIISQFTLPVLAFLKIFVTLKPNVVALVKQQTQSLEKMLGFVFIISLVADEMTNTELRNFFEYIQPWLASAAAIPFMFWVEEMDDQLSATLSSFLKKFNPITRELIEHCLGAIKYLKSLVEASDEEWEEYELLFLRDALWCFIDTLINSIIVSIDDCSEIVSEGLTFFIALLVDPPQAYAEDEKLILTETNLLIDEAASLICSLRENIDKGKGTILHELQEKINRAKVELRQLHVQIPGLSLNNFPQRNSQGYFDFLLGNLKKKWEAEADFFPFEKRLVEAIQKELVPLSPFLMSIFDRRDEHEELQDIWFRATSVAYLADHVTDCCLSFDVPIWSTLLHLSDAMAEIQLVKIEMTKTRNNEIHNRVSSAKLSSRLSIPRQEQEQEQASATTKDNVMVGFKLEESQTIDRLIGGRDELDIIAIVGMAGQGKTTLARAIFRDPRVQIRFKKCTWCCISQAYDIKEILLDILNGVGEAMPKEEIPNVSHEDLADKLRKCLKGQRYLIFLDDIWEIKAWHELQLSFPDDNKGSRILLTSRNRNVAMEAKHDCFTVELHPLSIKESWELLQMKIFEEDRCPKKLSTLGKTIAKNCRGLPLTIILVAGLLKKTKNVGSWKEIAESLSSYIASEGCMDVIELSYRHLPNFLKPCFLYLGVFQEDQKIDAKKLIQLWIAEGFVQNDGTKRSEVVANEYLNDLVDRSLVSVAKRSSRYGIKKCHLHDLLHDFCLIKAEQERFLLVPNESDHSSHARYDPCRLCISDRCLPLVNYQLTVQFVRSLHFYASGKQLFDFQTSSVVTAFKLLKVLDLEGVDLCSVFDKITLLIHLRFLSIACQFDFIPLEIVNLRRLEVFRLHSLSYEGFSFPSFMMRLENLQHIIVSEFYSSSKIEFEDEDEELQILPSMTNLETFTFLGFSNELIFERVAQKLPNVRKLGLRLDFCVNLTSYFGKLESLNLEITKEISPSRFEFPSTLKKLSLKHKDEELSGTVMSLIGNLSNLEVLKLDVCFENEEWVVEDDEFLNLKYLKLRYSAIELWEVSDESFPSLEQLDIKGCFVLRELPRRFGEVYTLKRINIRNCRKSISPSFWGIVDDQKDNGNEGLQYSISFTDPLTQLKRIFKELF